MTPDDIGRLVVAANPTLSPDGRWVAYTVNSVDAKANTYRSRLWLAAVDAATPPRPISSGEHRDGQPTWSPDGSWLAFTSNRPAAASTEKQASLHLLPIDRPGETITLARHVEGFGGLAFSPDGTRLAFTQRVRAARYDEDDEAKQPPRKITQLFNRLDSEGWTIDRPEHVFVVPIDGSTSPIDLTPDQRDHTAPVWLDDDRIVVTANRNDTFEFDLQQHLYVIDTRTNEVTALTTGDLEMSNASLSPDGTRLAVIGLERPRLFSQNGHVAVIDLETGDLRWITRSIDRTWSPFPGGRPPVWLDDTTLLASVEDRGDVHLYELPLEPGAAPRPALTGQQTISGFDARRVDGAVVAVYAGSVFDRPSEIHVMDSIGAPPRQLSDVTASFVRSVAPVEAEHFLAPSGGHEVDAWILRPKGFDPSKRYPMLLNIHGGPFTQYGTGFFDEAQIQAGAGFVVVMSNPRGGSGRDTAWGQAILGPEVEGANGTGWGSVDYDDVMSVVDTALERFEFIDPERLGVLGGSYGGYLTSWIVGHTDRFVAACSERSVNNMLSLLWQSDFGHAFTNELGVDFLTRPEAYLACSPITYVANMRTPLLILHSEDDLRCPIDQADQLYTALRVLDREVEYYRFPGESHELSRAGSPAHRIQRAELILEFFTRHLVPSAPDA